MVAWRRLTFEIPESAAEDLIVSLHEAGSLGVELVGPEVISWFPETVDETTLLDILRSEIGPAAVTLVRSEPVADGFWHERWVAALTPFNVGRRFVVIPGPATPTDLRGRLPVRLTPGRAFGTGEHATTRMCVELLEDCVCPGDSILDVGTGSGILAIAATRLGAGLVVGLDTDACAVEVAARNAAINDVRSIRFLGGSIDALSAGRFDVVVANITGTTLERILPALDLRVSRTAVLSGILRDEGDHILDLAARRRLRLESKIEEGDWLAYRLERETDG